MRSTWPPLLPARCRRSQSLSLGDGAVGGPPLGGRFLPRRPGHESGNLTAESRQFFRLQGEATASSSDAPDGPAAALACSRANRMAPQLSRCHPAAACALLGLQPGAISQTPNKRKLLNVFLELPFVLSLGDSPKFYQQKHPHGGGGGGGHEARGSGAA